MQIPAEVMVIGGSSLASACVAGGVAFGVLKGSMGNYVKHSDHREICHSKSEETNDKIDTLFDNLGKTTTKIDELSGYIRGKLGE